MEKRIRKTLFLTGLIIFILTAPVLILRSQGFRIDYNQKKLVRTGGIFINPTTPNVEIYLDEKLKKETGVLSSSAFIKNLLPKTHSIEIKKTGYFSWQKDLIIKEKEVAEIKDILLIKQNPQFDILLENIEDFFVSEDKKQILIKKQTENNWSLILLDIATNKYQEIFSTNKLENIIFDVEIKEWDIIENKILLQEKIQNKNAFIIIDYSSFPEIEFFSLTPGSNIEKITLNPFNEKEILFLKENRLFTMDIIQEGNPILFLSDVSWFEIKNKTLFLITPSGFILKIINKNNGKEILNKTPLIQDVQKEFSVFNFKENLLLNFANKLYKLNKQGTFEEIFSQIKGFKISPDFEKIVIWKNQEIWLSEKNNKEYFSFLNRFSKNIKSSFWLDSSHIIFIIDNEIKISEIDNRDKINIVTFNNFKNPKIFFSENNKQLYIFSENTLFISEKLLP